MVTYAVSQKSLINPMAYTFRNKEMKNVIRKMGKILTVVSVGATHTELRGCLTGQDYKSEGSYKSEGLGLESQNPGQIRHGSISLIQGCRRTEIPQELIHQQICQKHSNLKVRSDTLSQENKDQPDE